jgi:hypothetical protein
VQVPPQSEFEEQGSPHEGVPPDPAIIFFISALLSFPFMLARLIFCICIFLKFKVNKIVDALAFSIKGVGCQATMWSHCVVPLSFSFRELFQKKIL